MARPLRLEYPGAVYHVIARGNERRAVFWEDRDRELYLERLEHYQKRFGFRVYAYCLMTNHIHLAVEGGEGEGSVLIWCIIQVDGPTVEAGVPGCGLPCDRSGQRAARGVPGGHGSGALPGAFGALSEAFRVPRLRLLLDDEPYSSGARDRESSAVTDHAGASGLLIRQTFNRRHGCVGHLFQG